MPSRKHDIFVSYSTVHAEMVGRLVQILRLSERQVFHDRTSIQPGELWDERIMDSLTGATTVILLWCWHAASSRWVKKEYESAIKNKKRVVPVLLDDTSLPEELKPYQWIDMRPFFWHPPRGRFKAFVRKARRWWPFKGRGESPMATQGASQIYVEDDRMKYLLSRESANEEFRTAIPDPSTLREKLMELVMMEIGRIDASSD